MTEPDLPAPRDDPASYAIALVCLGNICRSPMAAVVLEGRLTAAGLADRVQVASAGTGDWHLGEPMDRRAAATLAGHGYDPTRHRSAQFDASWFDRHDLVLAMDAANLGDISALDRAGDGHADRVRMFRDFDPAAGADRDVPDPWFGGQDGFDQVMAMVVRTCDELVRRLTDLLGPASR